MRRTWLVSRGWWWGWPRGGATVTWEESSPSAKASAGYWASGSRKSESCSQALVSDMKSPSSFCQNDCNKHNFISGATLVMAMMKMFCGCWTFCAPPVTQQFYTLSVPGIDRENVLNTGWWQKQQIIKMFKIVDNGIKEPSKRYCIQPFTTMIISNFCNARSSHHWSPCSIYPGTSPPIHHWFCTLWALRPYPFLFWFFLQVSDSLWVCCACISKICIF